VFPKGTKTVIYLEFDDFKLIDLLEVFDSELEDIIAKNYPETITVGYILEPDYHRYYSALVHSYNLSYAD
jgi:hypothetical protein